MEINVRFTVKISKLPLAAARHGKIRPFWCPGLGLYNAADSRAEPESDSESRAGESDLFFESSRPTVVLLTSHRV